MINLGRVLTPLFKYVDLLQPHTLPVNYYGFELRKLSDIHRDQKVSVHLTITVQSSGASRLFDYPISPCIRIGNLSL